MRKILALGLLYLAPLFANAATPTKLLTVDIGRPENTFSLGPISRGSSEYIDCALYVRGDAYPTNDLSGYLFYSVSNVSTSGVYIYTVDDDTINGHVYVQMSTTDSLGLSTNSSDYPITYHAELVLTNATQTHVFDVGELVIRWDPATAGAGVASTFPLVLFETDPHAVLATGARAMSGDLDMGGQSITNVAAASIGFVGGVSFGASEVTAWNTATNSSGDITAVQVSGSILTVASGTGPIPIVGLTTAAVQSAQITYTAGTGLGLGTTDFNLNGASVASLALADSALQSYTETDPIWVAVSNTVTANALLGSTALQNVAEDTTPQLGGNLDANGGAITNLGTGIGGQGLGWQGGSLYTFPTNYELRNNNGVRWVQANEVGTFFYGTNTTQIVDFSNMPILEDSNGIPQSQGTATTGDEIVNYQTATNLIALLGGTTYSGGTNVDVNGTIINLDAAAVASDALADSATQPADSVTTLDGTANRLLWVNGSGDVAEIALGTAADVLTSAGTTSVPTWETPAAGGGGGNWWTNAPSTEIAIATNSHSGGLDLLGSDNGTNLQWVTTTASSFVGFHAYATGASVAISGWTTIICGNEEYDTDGLHNTTTGAFVPHANGYWSFGAAVPLDGTAAAAGERVYIAIYEDGVKRKGLQTLGGDGTWPLLSGSVRIHCTTTNSYLFKIYTGQAGATYSKAQANTWFQAKYEGQ